jgi:phosphotransferase system enzyme I (PtsI)
MRTNHWRSLGEEPNPALGVRGLPVAFDRPEILDRQLAAVVAAAEHTSAEVWVMRPWWRCPRRRPVSPNACGHTGCAPPVSWSRYRLPRCAPQKILEVADFANIGTNDLAQYAMAADRMAGPLAALNDPWQPGLLRLVEATGSAGTATGKPVGVCGEAASDPVLAIVLVGLGITSLSMSARVISEVGELLKMITHDECQRLAQLALKAGDAQTAKARGRGELPQLADLGP